MRLQTKLGILASIITSAFFQFGCATVDGNKAFQEAPSASTEGVYFQGEPSEFLPTLTLRNVRGSFLNVTSVKLKFEAVAEDFSLSPLGNSIWQVQFGKDDFKKIREAYPNGQMRAEVAVFSENSKRRVELRRQAIEIGHFSSALHNTASPSELHARIPLGKAGSL